MILNKKLKNAFVKHKVVKIIIGINNFNLNDIITKAKEAEIGQVTCIDVAANTDILYQLKKVSSLPICVSSIDSNELFACFKAGADILEVGNFDIFYSKSIILSPTQIVAIAEDIIYRAPLSCICVTIPHHLCLFDQIQLARQLENLGVDIIQTEGLSSKLQKNLSLINSLNKASSALSATYVFSKYTHIPIFSSSGISPLSGVIAKFYGASGLGIGSFISQLHDPVQKCLTIQYTMQSINYNFAINLRDENPSLKLHLVFDCINIIK